MSDPLKRGFWLSFRRIATLFRSYNGALPAIETCRRALAILKGYVPACAFRWDAIDRMDLEQNVPPVTRLYVRERTDAYGAAFVVELYLFKPAVGTPNASR